MPIPPLLAEPDDLRLIGTRFLRYLECQYFCDLLGYRDPCVCLYAFCLLRRLTSYLDENDQWQLPQVRDFVQRETRLAIPYMPKRRQRVIVGLGSFSILSQSEDPRQPEEESTPTRVDQSNSAVLFPSIPLSLQGVQNRI